MQVWMVQLGQPPVGRAHLRRASAGAHAQQAVVIRSGIERQASQLDLLCELNRWTRARLRQRSAHSLTPEVKRVPPLMPGEPLIETVELLVGIEVDHQAAASTGAADELHAGTQRLPESLLHALRVRVGHD